MRAPFEGTWRLAAYAPYGEHPLGRIQYDRGGRMWALLYPPDRPALPDAPTLEDYRASWTGLIAYYGSFDVNPATQQVTHHIEAASNPAWVGSDFVRWYRLAGDTLILSLNSRFSTTLAWERLGG